jgi:uncharacterized cupin superfamily protein
MATHRIINVDEIALESHEHGDRFAARDGNASRAIGARLLGCSYTEVPPGKRAWPFHNHHVNEEMFVILEGHGSVRIGPDTFPVRKGDIIASPPGGPDEAHQIINTGDEPLRYLSVSTKLPGELVEYPDSGKVMVYAGNREAPTYYHRGRPGPMIEYWDGE